MGLGCMAVTLQVVLGSPLPAASSLISVESQVERVVRSQLETIIPVHIGKSEMVILGAGILSAGALLTVDVKLYGWLQKRLSSSRPIFDKTIWLGDGLVDLLIVGAFALGDGRGQRVAIEGAEALVAVAIASTTLKHIFRESRPQVDPARKHYWQSFSIFDSTHDAMPSGHTMSAFATATVIAGEYPEAAPFVYSAASLVGLSVLMHGWHWPSDLVLGAALGYVLGRGALLANQGWLHVTPAADGLGLGLHAEW